MRNEERNRKRGGGEINKLENYKLKNRKYSYHSLQMEN